MPKRSDANQKVIVAALRDAGATVQSLHAVGQGTPDLLVGTEGITLVGEVDIVSLVSYLSLVGSKAAILEGANILMEVKNPDTARGRREAVELPENEKEWHEAWKGQVCVVTEIDEALAVLERRK